MARKCLIIISVVMLTSVTIAFAQPSLTVMNLIMDFRAATLSHDKEALKETYQRLKKDKEAREYMRINMPKFYMMYEAQALIERVENIDVGDHDTSFTTNITPRVTEPSDLGGDGGTISNSSVVKQFPNQNRVTNQKVVDSFSNQDRMQTGNTPNGIQTLRYSNQDRPSNSRYMRSQR